MFVLDEARTRELLALPESGMGFQFIEFTTDDAIRHFGLALNAEMVLDVNEPRDGLAGLRAMQPRSRPAIREVRLLAREHWISLGHQVAEPRVAYRGKTGPAKDAPIGRSKEGDFFVRFSAFANDRRINADKSLQPGTYATSAEDAVSVRTGIEAVRRYALPNPDPAVHRLTLRPPQPAPIRCGIVEPANGQPGGGVEVIFPDGTAPNTLVHQDRIPSH